MASDVTEHEALMRQADEQVASGRYKEAYNLLGHGPWGVGGDQELRYRRGLYAYNVAHQRLNEFQDSPSPKETLIKAGCWLARSEAYLSSAAEDVDEETRRTVEGDVDRTKREQDRFRVLCLEFGEDLFVSRGDTLGEN